MLETHRVLSPDMVVDRYGMRKDRCKKQTMTNASPLVALMVPPCFLLKLKRSRFQRFVHLFGPLKLLKKLSGGVSEGDKLGPTSVTTDTLANVRHSGGGG